MLTGKLHRYNHHHIVSNSQYLPMNMVLSTKARDASSAARAKATDFAPNISLYFLSLLFLLSFVFSPPTLKFLDSLPQFLICSQPTSPGPPLLPLFFITPFPKSLETFLSYQVIVFFSEIRNCDVGLAIHTFSEYQTKDAYHGKLYKTEFDITTLNTRKSPSLRTARVRHSSCSHKVKAHKAQPQPLLQLRSLRGVWRDLVVIFSLGNCHRFTISL